MLVDVCHASAVQAMCSDQMLSVCRASPEVAPYPFTTVTPNLGVTQIGSESESAGQRLVLADLPGLIEGAHQVSFLYLNVLAVLSILLLLSFSPTLNGIVISNIRNCCQMLQCIIRYPATTALCLPVEPCSFCSLNRSV